MSVLPAGWTLSQQDDAWLAVPDHLAEIASLQWMSAAQPEGQAVTQGGRQAAWFVQGPHGPAVLRHYRRGGLRARFGQERYFWMGAMHVRAFAEVRALHHLHQSGVRVPRPLAAAYWRHGVWYANALLTERIPSATPLADCLDRVSPMNVAQAIRAMHTAGVWHADLNVWNILVDAQDRVWLIDFDKARLGVVSEKQAQKNWLRLRRSLVKVAGLRGAQWWDVLFRDLA